MYTPYRTPLRVVRTYYVLRYVIVKRAHQAQCTPTASTFSKTPRDRLALKDRAMCSVLWASHVRASARSRTPGRKRSCAFPPRAPPSWALGGQFVAYTPDSFRRCAPSSQSKAPPSSRHRLPRHRTHPILRRGCRRGLPGAPGPSGRSRRPRRRGASARRWRP